MEVEYNPQVGVRRTLFDESYDFLINISYCQQMNGGLLMEVDTYRGKKAKVQIRFVTETIFRFRMFPEGVEEFSRNPVYAAEESINTDAKLSEHVSYYEYGTEKVQIRFSKKYWEMSIYTNGKLLTKEQVFDTNVDNRWKVLPTGYRMDENGKCIGAHETMYLYSDESFWGFGEKFTDFNKRGQYIHCWQKDALSTNTEDSYKGHPFFMSSRGYAVLLNTFTRCEFDMGNTSQVSYQMQTEDAYLDYIFLAEPSRDYKALLQQYISMMGEIPMIPKWALGFWMSKCTYRSRQEIEDVVTKAIEYDIPIDVIHIDFWQTQENMGTWEINEVSFPDFEGMIRWLEERHVHLSIWIYPYLRETSPMFTQLAEKGYFVKNREGKPALFRAMADEEMLSACFDFTNPEFLAWYKERVMAVLKLGVSVVKTDFSEAVPEEAVYYDGTIGVEGHNKITYLYAQTMYDWMKECGKETGKMPMLWGRSGYAGSHRIPAAWAGDSSSALNNHSAILKGGMSLAMSGVAFWGFDLGGFYNTGADGNECMPTDEEYLRSVEMGMYMPLARAHGKTPREPWNYSKEVLDIVRLFSKIRHRMLPYLYHTACVSHLESIPMLRPLLLEYPKDPTARMQDLTYMLGDALLVAPPFDREEYEVYLPKGKWLNRSNGEILDGGDYVTVKPALHEIPVFQRENTVIPKLGIKDSKYVPEGTFQDLELEIFFVSDMEVKFYDRNESGELQKYSLKAWFEKEDYSIRIETDMNVKKVRVKNEFGLLRIQLNGKWM